MKRKAAERELPKGEQGPSARRSYTDAILILSLTVVAFAVHGYHYGIEDEAIYLPAIKKLIDPSLYPHDSEFFLGQARGTILPWIIALVTRATHVPLPWMVVGAQFAAIYFFLFACWRVAAPCVAATLERLGGVALVAILLTMPVAGTAIYLADQHLHPRTVACALVMMAISTALKGRSITALLTCVVAFVVHPLMAIYGGAFVVVLVLPLERLGRVLAPAIAIPFIARPTPPWREALATPTYYTLRNWAWFEWLGLLAPMAVVWWLVRLARQEGLETTAKLMHRLLLYSAIMCGTTLAISLPRSTEMFWPLQPFRYLHTVYVLMILLGGGLVARMVLKSNPWRWALVMLPLAAIMSFAQISQFPNSSHVDFPGARPTNAYVRAFQWVRDNTPREAYFALDPKYMAASRNDHYGFRAIAERSKLADTSTDAVVVTVSPPLAPEWKRQVDATRAWKKFTADDFARLRHDFGVGWVLLDLKDVAVPQLDCPYKQASLAVCRTPL